MNIITKKRGRIAIAWLICITMIFASFAGPFSPMEAQASTEDLIITENPIMPEDPTMPEDPIMPEDPTTPEDPTMPEDSILFEGPSRSMMLMCPTPDPQPVSWTPTATKILVGKDLSDYEAGTFMFELTQTDPSTCADPLMAPNGHDGSIVFPTITYTQAGTYTYTLKEVGGNILGITYDASIITLTVKVIKNDSNQLRIRWAHYSDEAKFINKYTQPVSWTPIAIKVLEGKELSDFEAGTFEFQLTQTNPSTCTDPLSAFSEIDGSVTFPTKYYTDDGTYEYTMEEVGELVPGVTNDLTKYNIIVVVTWNYEYAWWDFLHWFPINKYLVAEVTYPDNVTNGVPVFTNTYVGPGSITVTKRVVLDMDDPEFELTKTFYAGLFIKTEEGMELVQLGEGDDAVDAIAKLEVVDSAPATDSETFVGLDLDQMYYIFETDEDGNIIETDDDGYILPKNTTGWYALAYENEENAVELTPEALTGSVTITNYFADFEAPFDPSVKVIKTVTVNNTPTASNLTFYAGLFEDKELTILVAFKPLPLNGGISAEASFAFYQDGVTPLKAGTTYYVAETNDKGVPLAGTAKELGFEITINGVTNNNSTVELIEEEAVVNIVNNFKKEEFPLTGDDSNMGLWLFLAMLGVAGAIAPFAFRKKEVAND